MGFIFSGAFWGVVLILLGISVLIKVIFQIDIPIIRGIFGVVVILVGISILMGRPLIRSGANSVIFNEGSIHLDENTAPAEEYNVIFGSATTDLSKITLKESNIHVKVNTIFGENKIRINPDMPVLIRSSAAFGEARMPDTGSAGFGTSVYNTTTFNAGKPHLILDINVVFGSARILTH